jgi:hypothetical protein
VIRSRFALLGGLALISLGLGAAGATLMVDGASRDPAPTLIDGADRSAMFDFTWQETDVGYRLLPIPPSQRCWALDDLLTGLSVAPIAGFDLVANAGGGQFAATLHDINLDREGFDGLVGSLEEAVRRCTDDEGFEATIVPLTDLPHGVVGWGISAVEAGTPDGGRPVEIAVAHVYDGHVLVLAGVRRTDLEDAFADFVAFAIDGADAYGASVQTS